MKVEKDYEELLKLFNKNKVAYCIVGAYAVALYAKPRYTKDMDILVKPDSVNAGKVLKSLAKFGFKNLSLSKKDFSVEGKIIQLGYEPLRVDILTSIDGCTFDGIWKTKTRGVYGNEKVFFIGLNELIKNKKATKRKQDSVELKGLLIIKRRKRKKK